MSGGESGRGECPNGLWTIEAATRAVLDRVQIGPPAAVPLGRALRRVLAAPVVCDIDYPPFDKAMMDGYAVRARDVTSAGAAGERPGPVGLRVIGRVGAGHEPPGAVSAGEAVQINTGAPVPPGADAVVRVEDTRLSEDGRTVRVDGPVRVGQHIDRRAKYVRAGSEVLAVGTRMGPGEIGAAAAAGAAMVSVYAQPRVGMLITGDELVDVSAQPRGARIRNSNGPMLRALLDRAGCEPVDLGTVGDDRALLTERIRSGLELDFLCITGGVSMGAFDFVPDVLVSCGIEIVFHRVAIKPGKPTLFGVSRGGTGVFGLPGNPAGVFVCFHLLVQRALAARQGLDESQPVELAATLVGTCPSAADRQSYWPARVTIDDRGALMAERLAWHGSGDPFGLVRANGLIVQPPVGGEATTGDTVRVMPTEPW